METVQIIFHDLKTTITDPQLCEKIQNLLRRRGILTHQPSIKRAGGQTQIVTVGIFGTVVEKEIVGCVTRYLEEQPQAAEFDYSSVEVICP
jgi:hypothetical protein